MNFIQKRNSSERGSFKRGWLNAKYTFSFSGYYDQNFMGFGDLLVINDDRIAAFGGFDTHPHKNMEIFTYILKGKMSHKDSIDGKERFIETGEFQYMAAGTGIRHSEKAQSPEETHLLQIWIAPDVQNAKPRYESRTKEQIKEMKKSPLTVLASGSGRENSIKFNNKEAEVLLLQLNKNEICEYILKENKSYYFQAAKGSLKVNNEIYMEGDSGRIFEASSVKKLNFQGNEDSQMIIFELRKVKEKPDKGERAENI